MREPVQYVGPAGRTTTRSREVNRVKGGGPVALQRRDSHRTSQIFLRPDELQFAPLEPANNTETIIFQSDPSLRVQLAKLAQAKKQVQSEIKFLRQKITRREYSRVVLRHTTYKRGWVAVKPPRFESKPSPPVFAWEKHWRVTELVSEEEWLRRMLQLTTLRVQQRRAYERQLLWWSAHPDVERAATRYWRSDPFFIRRTVIPEGALGSTRTPVKEFKRYPVRRWDMIRLDWSRRLRSITPRLSKLQRRLDDIKARYAELLSFRDYKPMVYSQRCESIPVNRAETLLVRARHFGLPKPDESADGTIAWMPGGINLQTYQRVITRHCLVRPVDKPTEDFTDVDWSSGVLRSTSDPATFEPYYQASNLNSSNPTWQFFGPRTRGHITEKTTRVATVEVLDDVDALERDLEDRLRASRLALHNLRLGRDDLSFNPFRSILEQKDIPQTVQSGRDFLQYARGATGQTYYEVVTSSGARTVLTSKTASSAQLRVLSSRKPTKAALRAVGLKRAIVRQVTKRSGLSVLAGLYLAHKFSIAPTASDINTCLEWGRDYCLTTRRGLGQLVRNHSLHFWAERSLYRTFSVGSVDMLRQKSNSRLTDHSIETSWQSKLRWVLNIPASDWLAYAGDEVPGSAYQSPLGPVYRTTGDLELWFPVPIGRYVRDSVYIEGIAEHNLNEIVRRIPERYTRALVAVRQILRGKAFARFSAKDLLRGLGDGSLRDRISGLHLVRSAWDLTNLSFVTEWFTNLGLVANAIDDVVNTKLSGLGLSRESWLSLTARVFSSQPVAPVVETRTSISVLNWTQLIEAQNPTSPYRHVTSVRSFPRTVQGTVDLVATLPIEVRSLSATGIRTAVRRVFHTAPQLPQARLRVSITKPQAGSLVAMLLAGR